MNAALSADAPRLILASASPGRARVLEQAGLDFEVIVSEVDEDAVVAEAREAGEQMQPAAVAQLLARAKAEAVAAQRGASGALVLGCDSVFEFDGAAYGKPYEPDVAVERWKQMRGGTGTLHSGHWLVDAGNAASTTRHSWLGMGAMEKGPLGVPTSTLQSAGSTVSTTVSFAEPNDEEITAYAETGEPLHCAGAFTIDGRGAAFIREVQGDHLSVIGVSPYELSELVTELGYSITQFWKA